MTDPVPDHVTSPDRARLRAEFTSPESLRIDSARIVMSY